MQLVGGQAATMGLFFASVGAGCVLGPLAANKWLGEGLWPCVVGSGVVSASYALLTVAAGTKAGAHARGARRERAGPFCFAAARAVCVRAALDLDPCGPVMCPPRVRRGSGSVAAAGQPTITLTGDPLVTTAAPTLSLCAGALGFLLVVTATMFRSCGSSVLWIWSTTLIQARRAGCCVVPCRPTCSAFGGGQSATQHKLCQGGQCSRLARGSCDHRAPRPPHGAAWLSAQEIRTRAPSCVAAFRRFPLNRNPHPPGRYHPPQVLGEIDMLGRLFSLEQSAQSAACAASTYLAGVAADRGAADTAECLVLLAAGLTISGLLVVYFRWFQARGGAEGEGERAKRGESRGTALLRGGGGGGTRRTSAAASGARGVIGDGSSDDEEEGDHECVTLIGGGAGCGGGGGRRGGQQD